MRKKRYLDKIKTALVIIGISFFSNLSYAASFSVDCDIPGYTPVGEVIASMDNGDDLFITGTCDATGEGAAFIDIRGKANLSILGDGATTITIPFSVNGSDIHFQSLNLEGETGALNVGQNSYVSAALTHISVNGTSPVVSAVVASASSHLSLQGNSSVTVSNSIGDAIGVRVFRDSSYLSAGPVSITVDALATATGVLVEPQGMAFVGGSVSVQGGASSVSIAGEPGSHAQFGPMTLDAPINVTGGTLLVRGDTGKDVPINATLDAHIIIENSSNVLGDLNLDFGTKALIQDNSTVACVNTFGAKPDEVLRIDLTSVVKGVNKNNRKSCKKAK